MNTIQDASGTVKLFAVTSCRKDFRPVFRTPDGHRVVLQESSFSDVSDDGATIPRYFLRGATTPSHFYDLTYGGNPGLYKTWIVGVDTACPWTSNISYRGPEYPFHFWTDAPTESNGYSTGEVRFDTVDGKRGILPSEQWAALPQVVAFREGTRINTYAETDIMTDPDALSSELLGVGPNPYDFVVGPDLIRVRTLPGFTLPSGPPSWPDGA